MTPLAREVKRFRDWAQHQSKSSGEWETDYVDWPALRAEVDRALTGESLADDEINLVLYALARDNECEFILGMLEEHAVNGLRVARAAVDNPDPDARWQAAVFLGTQGGDEPRNLLRRLVRDSHEYVRRRALLASVERDPTFAEDVAASWLTAEEEYSRLAAVTVLHDLGSKRLWASIEHLRLDPSPYVRKKVAEIEQGSLWC